MKFRRWIVVFQLLAVYLLVTSAALAASASPARMVELIAQDLHHQNNLAKSCRKLSIRHSICALTSGTTG